MQYGGWTWVALWPGLNVLALASAYAGLGPGLLGKRPDGTIHPVALTLLLPFFLGTWAVWALQGALARKAPSHEVVPGVWLGRRPFRRDLPDGIRLVVDLTAEFPVDAAIRAEVPWVCRPTLDATPPTVADGRALLDAIEAAGGPVFIHCAAGHGRSATVAAALLIRRGLAPDPPAAEAILRAARPGVRLRGAQLARVEELAARPEADPQTA